MGSRLLALFVNSSLHRLKLEMRALAVLILMLLSGISSANTDEPMAGEGIFANYCAMCHLPPSARESSIGPSLKGVFGRPVASFPGFTYTPAFRSLKGVWSESALNDFIIKPMARVPGTAMAFGGLSDANDRNTLITYLKNLN